MQLTTVAPVGQQTGLSRRRLLQVGAGLPFVGVLSSYLRSCGCMPYSLPGWSTLDLPNTGYHQARNGGREPIRIADVPYQSTADVIAPWNQIAGWELFRHDVRNPQITFEAKTPLIPPCDAPGGGCEDRSAWMKRFLNPDTSILRSVGYYDPQLKNELQGEYGLKLWQHEIGHLIGIGGDTCGNGYEGVMSYCRFPNQPRRFGADDVQILRNLGYAA